MPIITVSRGSYSRGKEVAEKVAERLGYRCLSRDDLISEASEEFDTPEVKLKRAIHDAPSILSRFTHGRERFVAYAEAALLERVQPDNIVYHGLAGHFFLRGVSHVLKVRIIADLATRVRFEMEREGITAAEAERLLRKDDEERRKWSLDLYGIDPIEASLYDLVIHVHNFTTDDAVDMICRAAELERFGATKESQAALDDLLMAARIKVALISDWPDIQVSVDKGGVQLRTRALTTNHEAAYEELQEIACQAAGIKELRIIVKTDVS